MKIPALLAILFASAALAQDKPTPEDEARAAAWHIAVAIVGHIEKNDTTDFPGARAWLKDFHAVQEKSRDGDMTKPFRAVDSDALVTHNANWWAAYYEIAPGDPELLALHSMLLLAGGEPQRAQQLAVISMQRPGIPKNHLQGLLLVIQQSQKAIARSHATARAGVQLHDANDFEGAIKKYDEALILNPANGWAHYERGFSIRMRALTKSDEPAPKKGTIKVNDDDAKDSPAEKEAAAAFALARRHDPFQVSAYQGSDQKVIAGMMAFHKKLKPSWDLILGDISKQQDDATLLNVAEGCREMGIHDYTLVARQIIIARRKRYAPEDHPIIGEHLRALAPGPVVERTIKRLAGETMKGLMLAKPEGDAGLLLAPPPKN